MKEPGDEIAQLKIEVESLGEFSALLGRVSRAQPDSIDDVQSRIVDIKTKIHIRLISVFQDLARANFRDTPPLAELRRAASCLRYLLLNRRKDAMDLGTIAASGFFDAAYYVRRYPDVAGVEPLIHYLDHGAKEGRDPSPVFDTSWYLESNRDVAESGINPLLHYIRYGRKEGRFTRPFTSVVGGWPHAPRLEKDFASAFGRIVVYTAVVGGYDDLQPPQVKIPNCDFVAFSDRPLDIEGWRTLPLNYVHADPTRAARFVKLHPHLYFPDYRHSIWIDANIGIRGDVREFLTYLTARSFLGIFLHPQRNCIYQEANECIRSGKDDADAILKQIEAYRAQGYPEQSGLWETNVLVQRHNDPACIALMTAWWREIELGSRRDQLSLPPVAGRQNVKIAPLGNPGDNARLHPILNVENHRPRRNLDPAPFRPYTASRDVEIAAAAVDIGVCVHNQGAETIQCLTSLIAARGPEDRIIIVDDASDAATAGLLDRFTKDHDRIELIRHAKNEGYTRSANEFFRASRTKWVALFNSDTIVPANALRKLIAAGEQFSQLGIVGPLSNAASWQSIPLVTDPNGGFLVNELPSEMTVDGMDFLCEEISGSSVLFVPLVNGFCMAVRRDVFDAIGYFDDVHFPTGYGEENDFCFRAGDAGFTCGIVPGAYVYHHKSLSFTPGGRKALVKQTNEALRQKYGAERIAAAVRTLRDNPELARIRERVTGRQRDFR